jgi:dihydropteroate synthase
VQPHFLDLPDLKTAKEEIARVGASPVSVEIMAAKAVFKVIKAYDLSPTAANILKQEMLSKGGEAAVGDQVVNCRQPKTDVVLMGTIAQYRRVIKTLKIQPVGLPNLAQQLEDLLKDL